MRPENIPDEITEMALDGAYQPSGEPGRNILTRGAFAELWDGTIRAALAAAWGEIQARTLEEAADRLEAYVTGKANVPDDDRWTIDIGYHGEAAWLCAEAERVRGDR